MPLFVMIAAVAWSATAQRDGLRELTSGELRSIVRGSTITRVHHYEAPANSNLPPPPNFPLEAESFWVNGRYAGEFDNYEPYGSYRITRGQVCVSVEREKENCFVILEDHQGQYWMKKSTWPGPVRVTIEKIVNRP
jgi:hypothetical protein